MNKQLIEDVAAFKAHKERLLGRLLNRSYRYMSELASEFLTKKGYINFRVGHVVALVHIDIDGSSVNAMALKAGISKQAMSKLVQELQKEGFVETDKDPADARALVVKLTDKGLQCLMDWKACVQHIDEVFAEILGTDQLEKLKDILVVLAAHYEQNVSGVQFDKSYIGLDLVK